MTALAEQAEGGRADQIKPFMVESAGVRGRLARLGEVSQDVIDRHEYPPLIARQLAEMMALGAALASLMKFEGIFTLQAKGSRAIRAMVADITSEGGLRGYAQIDETELAGVDPEAAEAAPLAELFGEGHLAFTVDQGQHSERYQGIVQLTGTRLGDSVQHYFRQSEQLSTAIRVAAGEVEGTWRAGALILQQMPPEEAAEQGLMSESDREEGWIRALTLMSTTKDAELLSDELRPNELLFRLYHEDGVRVFPPRGLFFACRCSRTRVERVLASLDAEELRELTHEDGSVDVVCEFCKESYHLSAGELETLLAPRGEA